MNYLEKGEVERLEVINGTLVKAYLHRDGAGSLGVSHMTVSEVTSLVVCVLIV